jgi:hypothetical protein
MGLEVAGREIRFANLLEEHAEVHGRTLASSAVWSNAVHRPALSLSVGGWCGRQLDAVNAAQLERVYQRPQPGWLFLPTDGLAMRENHALQSLKRQFRLKYRLERHLALITVPPQAITVAPQAITVPPQTVTVPSQGVTAASQAIAVERRASLRLRVLALKSTRANRYPAGE